MRPHNATATIRPARVGCPYHQAQALADSADERDLRDSLRLSHALGAQPMAQLASARLRGMGAVGIARGPRHSTRGNPAGLTGRQMDVLALLSADLSNAEIAARLVVSAKTVDHHVSAIFRTLGVHDRAAAGRQAKRLEIKDRGSEEGR